MYQLTNFSFDCLAELYFQQMTLKNTKALFYIAKIYLEMYKCSDND